MLLTNTTNISNNGINNNINKCVTKLGDIVVKNGRNGPTGQPFAPVNGNNNQTLVTNNGQHRQRVRHYSQQQLANNLINNELNRVVKPNKDIDEDSINSFDCEEHVNYLKKKIELTLKEAKETKKLNCTEILIPHELTQHIAQDMIAMAETEPCGLRGCCLYINIEEKTLCRRLGEVRLDKGSVPTFEMYLTLKKAIPGWIDAFENRLLGKESVILSEVYRISKKKLYRSLGSP